MKSAFDDFRRNKIRTFLTSLGILVGVLAVVLLIAFGLGLKAYIKNQFESLGTNIVVVLPGQPFQGGGFRSGPGAIGSIRFDEKDYNNLKKVKNSKYVVPGFTKTTKITTNGANEIADLYATSPDVFPARNLTIQHGNYFTKEDLSKRSKVAVIGPKLAEKVFGQTKDALQQRLKIEGLSFVVIGVLDSKGGGGFGGPDFDSFIYVPYTTGFVFNPDKKFLTFILRADNEEMVPLLKAEIQNTFLKRYKNDEFSVVEQTEILNAIGSIFGIINTVLVAIAAVSLLVGGIGIMNIMYVSVTERIKEIGIRRALGARKKDILLQFLVESVILSLFGGILGLLLAFLITLGIQVYFPAYIDLNSVLLAMGVSISIGMFFGVFPARQAANLSPIEAIRYE